VNNAESAGLLGTPSRLIPGPVTVLILKPDIQNLIHPI